MQFDGWDRILEKGGTAALAAVSLQSGRQWRLLYLGIARLLLWLQMINFEDNKTSFVVLQPAAQGWWAPLQTESQSDGWAVFLMLTRAVIKSYWSLTFPRSLSAPLSPLGCRSHILWSHLSSLCFFLVHNDASLLLRTPSKTQQSVTGGKANIKVSWEAIPCSISWALPAGIKGACEKHSAFTSHLPKGRVQLCVWCLAGWWIKQGI